MNNVELKLKEAIENVFEKLPKEKVMAIYVTGSCLNNLMTETSDIDLYVILEQEKRNLVFGTFNSGQEHGENDFKYMETYKFVQMLYKTNPNLLEIIFKEPVYCDAKFKELACFLYSKRNEIVKMNSSRYYSSAYHMCKNNYTKLKNGTGKVNTGRAGKEVFNFYKAYNQAIASSKNKDLKDFVEFHGEQRDFLMSHKVRKSYSVEEEQELLVSMEKCLEELLELKEKNHDTKDNPELLNKMIDLL